MKLVTALPVLAALAFAPAALAEDAPPPPADHMAMMAKHRTEFCADRYAHTVGKLAELETRLALTSAQKTPFERWKDAKLKHAKAASSECNEFKPLAPDASIIDRRNVQIARLEKRLATLKAETPALEALVKVLTPEQQNILTRAAHEGAGERMGMMHRFGDMRGMRPMGAPMGDYGPAH